MNTIKMKKGDKISKEQLVSLDRFIEALLIIIASFLLNYRKISSVSSGGVTGILVFWFPFIVWVVLFKVGVWGLKKINISF